jgi:PhzF family phenazine biosynthesis protein
VLGPRRWSQTSSGATLAVEADGAGATMTQPPPTLTEVDATGPCRAAGVAGSAWVGEAAGMRHLMVATEAPIETIRPDLAVVAAAAEVEACTTFAVVRRRSDRELHVRVFVPGAGIAEDPGTGSAAGPIAVLAHEAWGTEPCMTIRQGAEIGRPCMLEVDVRGPAPVVGGRVVACAEGVFTV